MSLDKMTDGLSKILGISAFYHDSAAALLCDGNIIAAAQEERFSRKKHDPSFPAQSIQYCLHEGNIAVGDLDGVIFYDKPLLKFERLLETYISYAPAGFRSFAMAMPIWLKEKLFLKETLRKELASLATLNKKELPNLYFAGHHCPSSNKWNRSTFRLSECFAHHFHVTRHAVGSANYVSRWSSS